MLKRIIIAVVVVAALAGAGWWAWVTYGDGADEPESATIAASGTVEAEQIAVSALVAGRVETLSVEPGDEVRAGDVLLELDNELLELQVEQAEAGVRAAQASLNQLTSDAASQAARDQAQARLDQATATRDMAAVQAGYASVTAPVAGRVISVSIAGGENVSPGRTLVTIADLSRLYVSVYVPETEIAQLQVGVSATVTTGSSAESFEASVVRIASEAEFTPANVETKEQRVKLVYEVRLEVRNRADALKPGMPVDVAF